MHVVKSEDLVRIQTLDLQKGSLLERFTDEMKVSGIVSFQNLSLLCDILCRTAISMLLRNFLAMS